MEETGLGGDGELNGRMCIVSRRSLPSGDLIRFVVAPDGSVVPDLKRRLPGRGAHVEARREAVDEAVRRQLFRRAFRRDVKAAETLGGDVERLLVASVTGALGLARKAGQLATGAAKVEAAIRSGKAAGVLHARDAAPDGVRKMEAARRAAAASGRNEAIGAFRPLTSEEMSLALGGANVIHAAILAGDAGAALLKRVDALSKYRGESPSEQDVGCGVTPAQEAEA